MPAADAQNRYSRQRTDQGSRILDTPSRHEWRTRGSEAAPPALALPVVQVGVKARPSDRVGRHQLRAAPAGAATQERGTVESLSEGADGVRRRVLVQPEMVRKPLSARAWFTHEQTGVSATMSRASAQPQRARSARALEIAVF